MRTQENKAHHKYMALQRLKMSVIRGREYGERVREVSGVWQSNSLDPLPKKGTVNIWWPVTPRTAIVVEYVQAEHSEKHQ